MTPTREFFIGQDYYGSAPAPDEQVHNEIHSAIGQAFFCPLCATLWATVVIEGQPTTVRHRPCAAHRPGDSRGQSSLGRVANGDVPGSIFLTESRAWNEVLPPRVIARELLVHLAWASQSPVIEKSIASSAEAIYNYLHQQRRSK